MQNIDSYVNDLVKKGKPEEPWDGYYMLRAMELDNLFKLSKIGHFGNVLDIGCGNGFSSHLFSLRADNVTACDLYSEDARRHSPGLHSAINLSRKAQNKKVRLSACSAEEIPFKDGAFDTVYAGYVMQYIKDRPKALNEIKRVVKKDGLIIFMLPNFIERIYAFIQFYLYMFIKAVKAVLSVFFIRKRGDNKQTVSKRVSKFKQDYKYFPFSGPHGAYRNSAVEMIRHLPYSWDKEFKQSGLKVAKSFTTTFLPYPVLLTISLKMASILSSMFKDVTGYLGDKPFIKYLGYNYCVVLKKQ